MNEPKHTPVAWQKFGKDYYLTGQFGMRPIFLAATDLRLLRDGLLVPFMPEHEHAKRIVDSWNQHDALLAENERLREALRACMNSIKAIDENWEERASYQLGESAMSATLDDAKAPR